MGTIPKLKNKTIDIRKIQETLKENKIATLDQIKASIDSSSTMTVFRRLKEIGYLSSYSHRGKYYTLYDQVIFNELGLWSFKSVWFSKYGNLMVTAKQFITNSKSGYTANELEKILNVELKHTLLKLFNENKIYRKKLSGVYIYFSQEREKQKQQIAFRIAAKPAISIIESMEINEPYHELNAAIIIFFSLLDEKQRRLYAGLESFKIGHGGDTKIANLLGLDAHTVSKGRRELFGGDIDTQRTRGKGAGRKRVEKKPQKSSKKSKN